MRPFAVLPAGPPALVALSAFVLSACYTPPQKACQGRVAGDLVITEFLADPEGVDTGKEYIELFNATGEDISLDGITLYLSRADGTSQKTHVIRSGTAPARGYFVVGDSREEPHPSYLGYSYGADLGALNNSDGTIGLRCGNTVLDEVRYTRAAKAAKARSLDGKFIPDSAVNDVEDHWCDAPTELTPGLFGSPGAANAHCTPVVSTGCLDPATGAERPIVKPGVGDLVITELMPDPAAAPDTDGEWLELYARASVDLNGLELSNGTGKTTLASESCLRLNAGSYAVFARKADPGVNGGISGVQGTLTFSMVNSGGTLTVRSDVVEVDALTYGPASSGVAIQLEPSKLDAALNDDPNNLCPASQTYGAGDKGTPGAANTACATLPDPNSCIDGATSQSRPIVRPGAGQLVITELMPNPAAVDDASGEWIELHATAAVDLNGVELVSGTSKSTVAGSTCIPMSPGGYAVFARKADPGVNGGIEGVWGTFGFALANSGGALSVRSQGSDVDAITYGPSTAGVALQLDPTKLDAASNDDPQSFCAATAGYGTGGDKGTPAAANSSCPTPPDPNSCIDPTTGTSRPMVPPSPGDLIITEYMPDPSAVLDTAGEWFEVLVKSDVDLNGLELVNEGTGRTAIVGAGCMRPGAGNYVLFARSNDPWVNGGLPDAVVGTFSFALNNSGTAPDGGPRMIALRLDGGVLDAVTYSSSTSGASTQLDANAISGGAVKFCATATGTYGLPDGGTGDRGTPAAQNEVCP